MGLGWVFVRLETWLPGAGFGAQRHRPSRAFPRLQNGPQVLPFWGWEVGSSTGKWALGLGCGLEQRLSPVCLGSEMENKFAVSGVKPRGHIGHLCRGAGGLLGVGRMCGPLPEVGGLVMLVPEAWEASMHHAKLNVSLWGGKRCFSTCVQLFIRGVYNSWNSH